MKKFIGIDLGTSNTFIYVEGKGRKHDKCRNIRW